MAYVGMLFDRGLGRFCSFAGRLQLVSGRFSSFQLVLTFINYALFLTAVKPVELEQCLGEIASLYPDKHPMLSAINGETILCKENTKKFSLVWNACFVQVLDRPFSWIDYAPISRVVVFGADQQVWAHLKSLQHSFPKRYSWISVIFSGPFHKLANAHEKLCKRYGKFHIEKHAVSYLDDPSWPKVKYLLSMKDFDTSNEFFYHDIISGLTELSIAYLQYKNNSPDTHISLQSIDARDLIQFCDKHSANNPTFKKYQIICFMMDLLY